jgi:hypothetical protein
MPTKMIQSSQNDNLGKKIITGVSPLKGKE